MKFNTNSNVYIIIYSVVMVVIVAVLLSLAALGLKPRQDENILNEKKTQIVKALGYDAATTSYDEVVAEALLLNADGAVVESDVAKVFEALQSVKDSREAGSFPIFKATDGSVVVPLYGAGLWGPIWGYVALAPDMNTVRVSYSTTRARLRAWVRRLPLQSIRLCILARPYSRVRSW